MNTSGGARENDREGYEQIITNTCKVAKMTNISRRLIIALFIILWSWSLPAFGKENTREQLKGLDEQVQEIKSDVISIAAELNQLEEKLFYPSNTEVTVFIALAHDETFRLDSVEIQLEGQPVAHHIYTYKELEALRKGGVQNIYTGNILSGVHELQVFMKGKSTSGADLQKTGRFKVKKEVGPKIVEISLAAQGITFKD